MDPQPAEGRVMPAMAGVLIAVCVGATLQAIAWRRPLANIVAPHGMPLAPTRTPRNLHRRALSAAGRWSRLDRALPRGAARIRRRLDVSGVHAWSADEVRGLQAVAAVIGATAAAPLGVEGVLLAPALALVGFATPGLVIARAAARRLRRIDGELPQLLDVVAAASFAGLAGPLAIRRAVDALDGPLAEELRRVVEAIDLGGRWRDELAGLAERLDLPDVRRTVSALTRTETLGSSLIDATTALAARVREARRAATTERARTAPVKMLFPLVFLVLPAFLLLTVVPVLFSTIQSIR
jgi:tight adherence protein C